MGIGTTASTNKLRAKSDLNFKMGGSYRMCYSFAGSFQSGDAIIVGGPTNIEVAGVYDKSALCQESDPLAKTKTACLSEKRYECYLRKRSYSTHSGTYGLTTSCIVDFAYLNAGYTGTTGKGSWSGEWTTAGYHPTTGELNGPGVTKTKCGTSPATFICRWPGCDSENYRMDEATNQGFTASTSPGNQKWGQFKIPTTSHELTGEIGHTAFKARSVHACYCPIGPGDTHGCASYTHFTQEVGVLHFYLTKVCHADDTTCKHDYIGSVAQYRFRVRVECPTDACKANQQNRLKLVQQTANNDLPKWSGQNGCRTALHGMLLTGNGNNMKMVLPKTTIVPVDGSPPGHVNHQNCAAGSPLNCNMGMHGGTRRDYKVFPQPAVGDYGFRFMLGSTNHELRTFHTTKDVDMCYCNEMCGVASNWFKVGTMKLTPSRLVSAATDRSNTPSQFSLEYINQEGTIGLYRPYSVADALGLQENSLLKVLQDDNRDIGDFGAKNCGDEGYNSQFTYGLANPVQASLNYLGKRQMQTIPDLKKIVFNSDTLANTITVTAAGAIAVCYCAITEDSTCTSKTNWKLVTHLTIKGPKFNQQWTFSTDIVFRFTYEGYGLSDADTVRIISTDGQCTDNNYNPNTAAFAYTGMSTDCPVPCNQVQTVTQTYKGDLSQKVLSESGYKCDRLNANCQTNDIIKVQVVSDTETDIYFQTDPHLKIGEEITLGDNIDCEDPKFDTLCTSEMVAALKGVFYYGDASANNGQAPDSYILPNKVSALPPVLSANCPQNPLGKSWPNCKIARIQIGWPANSTGQRPGFRVTMAGAQIQQAIFGRGGKWTMHSKATTREEAMGSVEKANMRVCWRYGGIGGKYVAEIGRITIKSPAPLEGATLSMSTTLRDQISPFILTFRTSGGVTGLRYDQAQDSLRLKIVFTHTHLIDIYYSDINGATIPNSVPAEDEMEEATQAVCGKLFMEVWSSDMSNGFPLPKGCWYQSYPGSNRRELFLIFEAKSGLKKDTIYQLVFNAKVLEKRGVIGATKVYKGGYYMQVFPMDDVTARPYEAIEKGPVKLTTTPQHGPLTTIDPRFRVPDGFKIVGGHEKLVELKSGDSLLVELMGDRTSGRIMKGHIIRVYLWPLLSWQTTSSCTAKCVFQAERSFKCGTINSCIGEAAVPGMSLNILKITLPPVHWEELYGDKKIMMEIGGITPPTGGFFAQRMPAAVYNENDQRPHYIMSTGDYLMKNPNEGTTVTKVVGSLGGGNIAPFRGDTDNTLYVKKKISSTLRKRDT
jgi:hypothetical protein